MSQARFLLIGLPPRHPSVPEHIRDQIAIELEETLPNAAKEAGLNLDSYWVVPEDPIDKFKNELISRPDVVAVVIGFGVRGNPGMTILFEQLVNTIVEVAPKKRILFNSNVMSTIDAIKRYSP